MFEYIKSDLARKQTHYILVDSFVEKYVKTNLQLGTLAVLVYRLGAWSSGCRALGKFFGLILYQCLNVLIGTATGISINRHVPIGGGFIIHNFSCIMIEARSIGNNFTINQGVTVGLDSSQSGTPEIGNNVFIGSGAKVLGHITIGNNVVVAANAYVNRSVPDNCTVVGVPARIISQDGASDYLCLT